MPYIYPIGLAYNNYYCNGNNDFGFYYYYSYFSSSNYDNDSDLLFIPMYCDLNINNSATECNSVTTTTLLYYDS